jgi:hypothetical protein
MATAGQLPRGLKKSSLLMVKYENMTESSSVPMCSHPVKIRIAGMKTKEMRLGWLTLAAILTPLSATSSGFAGTGMKSQNKRLFSLRSNLLLQNLTGSTWVKTPSKLWPIFI